MSSEAELSPPSFRASEGDWTCGECGNINFARRTSCNRCNKDKAQSSKKRKLGHEIGKAAAEKSRGLFSADDWQCNKCGNVNWARRQQCNVCNAPKFGEVEERTGFGGGYNDRGVVEYKDRIEDSDDEYDEFGRRKKLRRKNDDSSSDEEPVPIETKTKPQKQQIEEKIKEKVKEKAVLYEDEEEDDDDDDDGDLSKYDLTDFVDEPVTKTKSKRNSRSNSPH